MGAGVTREQGLPTLTGRPGARQPDAVVGLRDGRMVTVREIAPGDAELLSAFDAGLCPASRQLRYLGWMAPMSTERAARLATVDGRGRFALVAIAPGPRGLRRLRRLVGDCRLDPVPGREGSAEIAIAVADDFQDAGLGRVLLERTLAAAAERGLTEVVAQVRYDNARMMHLLRGLGFERTEWELGVVTFRAKPATPPVPVAVAG